MYAKSQEWKLSTSGFSAGVNFLGTGFGAAWPDGYGINCELKLVHVSRDSSSQLSPSDASTGAPYAGKLMNRPSWTVFDQIRNRIKAFLSDYLDDEAKASSRAEL